MLDLSRLWQHLYDAEHLPDPGPVPVKYPSHDQSAWKNVVTDGRLSSGALRLSFWLRSIHLFPTSVNPVFHCPLCGVSSTGWGTHLQSHCPLVPGAVIYAFICVYNHLAEIGWHPVFSSCCSLTAVHPTSGLSTWRLVPDSAIRSPGAATPSGFAITWSGLIWCSGELTLPRHLRCHLTTTFLGALDRWLFTDPTLRWDNLTQRCTTSSAPPATALLATILRHLLQLPPSHVHGPLASSISTLDPSASALQPSTHHLYIDTHVSSLPSADSIPICIFPSTPLGAASTPLPF